MQTVKKFDLFLTPEQEEVLDRWTEVCRRTWNMGLGLLIEWKEHMALNKEPIDWVSKFSDANKTKSQKTRTIAVPTCPFAIKGEDVLMPMPVRLSQACNKIPLGDNDEISDEDKIVVEGGKRFKKVWGLRCWILPKGRAGGTVNKWTGKSTHWIEPELIRVGGCCPLPVPEWKEPRLGLEIPSKYTLQYYFTQTNIKEVHPRFAEEFCEVPIWFIRGTCKALTEAWSRHSKGEIGIPRFKRLNDLTKSLTHHDGKAFSVKPLDEETGERFEPGSGTIKIPKLGEVVASKLWQEWGDNPIAVMQLVKTVEKDKPSWKLHLTGYEIHPADIYNVARLAMAQAAIAILSPLALFELLCASPWALKRNTVTTLTVPGKDDVVAVDDRGIEYSVFPRRPTDGAIDPHDKIKKLDEQILALQQTISRQERRTSGPESNRLGANRQKLASLKRRRTKILSRNRKKIAHFLSERSSRITINQQETQRIRKPKRKLKAKSIDPAVFEPNAASRVAEHNRKKSDAAPGEFIMLLKNEAKQRSQPIRIVKIEKSK